MTIHIAPIIISDPNQVRESAVEAETLSVGMRAGYSAGVLDSETTEAVQRSYWQAVDMAVRHPDAADADYYLAMASAYQAALRLHCL